MSNITTTKHKCACGICSRPVNRSDSCFHWIHYKCNGLSLNDAVKRIDLSLTSEEFETVWVEIKNIKSKNILCCCAYRHPSSPPERFTEHIETVLHNLVREKKNIFILADFNINPLNCVNRPASETFLNMMNSNYLLPYILQPTRVTDRSATLIDNIFANTFYFNALISGNLVIL